MKNWMTLLLLFVAAFEANVFGVGFIGSPSSSLDKGQMSLGFDYSCSSLDLGSALMQRQSDEYFNGVLLGLTTTDQFRIKHKDLNVNRYNGVFSYGIEKFWEFNLKVGIADTKGQSYAENERTGHNFDNDFTWGWGTKLTFLENDNIDWGVSFQMNWLDTDWSKSTSTSDAVSSERFKHDVNIKTYDMLLAIGPTIDLEGWRLYGGAFYHRLSGDYKNTKTESTTLLGDTITRIEKSKGDFRTDGIGGFLGVQVDLNKYCYLSSEFSATDYGWAVGNNITFVF